MKKISLGLCLSLLMFVGACGEGTVPALPATPCSVSNSTDGTVNCFGGNPLSFTCCDAHHTVQTDKVHCPVKGLGGKNMRCMLPTIAATPIIPATPITPATECVADKTCVASTQMLPCCSVGFTSHVDASCTADATKTFTCRMLLGS